MIDFALKNFPVKIEKTELPIRYRNGIKEWLGNKFSEQLTKTCRIYPQDNDTEGFFVAKIKLSGEIG